MKSQSCLRALPLWTHSPQLDAPGHTLAIATVPREPIAPRSPATELSRMASSSWSLSPLICNLCWEPLAEQYAEAAAYDVLSTIVRCTAYHQESFLALWSTLGCPLLRCRTSTRW